MNLPSNRKRQHYMAAASCFGSLPFDGFLFDKVPPFINTTSLINFVPFSVEKSNRNQTLK